MKTISISDARNHLPSVIDEVVKTHEQVVVVRHGIPTAAIVPLRDVKSAENPYPLRGHPITLAEGFDAPMPNLWEAMAVAEEQGQYGTPAKRGRKG